MADDTTIPQAQATTGTPMQDESGLAGAQASSTDVKAPDNCPNCGAGLKHVPDVSKSCPHCGHLFENLMHFGAQHWSRYARQHRDSDPERQAEVSAEGLDYSGPTTRG